MLAGCVTTMPQNSAGNSGSGISAAIIQFDNEHPGVKKICVALDDGFKYSVGEFVLNKNSLNSDDVLSRWEHLVRLGLFTKRETVAKVTYKITQQGRNSYNDGKCSTSVARYAGAFTGPALVYGSLEFDQVVKTEKNPYHPAFTTSFKKKFAQIENWATDKEFRRSWKLQGLEEVKNFNWFASYRITSNGIDFTDTPQLYVLQN